MDKPNLTPLPPFERTSCSCDGCTAGCKTMPGALIAGDLERIAEHTGNSADDPMWLMNHFLASDGTIVATQVRVAGELKIVFVNIPSITPAQLPDGRCVFLSDDDRCTIHPVSPYGCAYHDIHMTAEPALARSKYAIQQHITSHNSGDKYAEWCTLLRSLGLVTKPLTERRDEMEKLINAHDRRVAATKAADIE